MRILMFGWEFPPYLSGGLGTACYGITQALVQSGTDVIFVLPQSKEAIETTQNKSNNLPKILSTSEINIPYCFNKTKKLWEKHACFYSIKTNIFPYSTTLSNTQQNPIYNDSNFHQSPPTSTCTLPPCCGGYGPQLMEEIFRYTNAAEYIAKQESFDVIHAHDWMTFLAGVIAKKVSKKKFIAHVHATEFDRSGEHPNQHIFQIEKTGLEQADHIIAVSNYTRTIIMNMYNIPEHKISVVHNAVLPSSNYTDLPYKKKSKKKHVLFLGRITRQKAPEHFINAAYLVAKKIPNVNFIMAGSGDLLTNMIDKVSQLKLGNRFHFTGFLHDQNVERIYTASDIYVMPSISEPFGITPLEAIRHGTPVIISKQSGVSEVIKHALQVDFWDIHRLAHLICSLLIYPKLTFLLAKKSWYELEKIRWEYAAQKLHNIYSNFHQNR